MGRESRVKGIEGIRGKGRGRVNGFGGANFSRL